MSLLDDIATADGSPARNYLKGGRTVGRIRRVEFRDATSKLPKAAFRVDVEILGSTNDKHKNEKGQTGTMNLGFKYADQDLARMRRGLAAALSSKEGRTVTEKEAAEKVKDLVGEKQPLVGALVTIVGIETEKRSKPGELFTKYEIEVPTENDLTLVG